MDDAGVRFAVKRIGIGLGLIGIEQNLLVQQALDVVLLAGIEFRGAVLGIRAIPKLSLLPFASWNATRAARWAS